VSYIYNLFKSIYIYMPIIWIIVIIFIILIFYFVAKSKNTSKKINELETKLKQKNINLQKEMDIAVNKELNKKPNHNLISSKTCTTDHPCLIHLYTDSNDKDLYELWEDLIKLFDKATYHFSRITDPKIHMDWKVEVLPTLRCYRTYGMCDPDMYVEFKGKFDKKSMKSFIESN
jgi:hypothetical protein